MTSSTAHVSLLNFLLPLLWSVYRSLHRYSQLNILLFLTRPETRFHRVMLTVTDPLHAKSLFCPSIPTAFFLVFNIVNKEKALLWRILISIAQFLDTVFPRL